MDVLGIRRPSVSESNSGTPEHIKKKVEITHSTYIHLVYLVVFGMYIMRKDDIGFVSRTFLPNIS